MREVLTPRNQHYDYACKHRFFGGAHRGRLEPVKATSPWQKADASPDSDSRGHLPDHPAVPLHVLLDLDDPQ